MKKNLKKIGDKILQLEIEIRETKDSENKNYYLNVITTTKEKDETQFLGKFAKSETPANPNDNLEEGEDPILPYIK